MFHDETSCFIQDTPSDDFFKCVPRVGAAQSCLGGELSGFTSSSGALADKFEKDSPFSVEVEHVSASGFYPLCGHDNEHSQEPLEPRGPIKPFDPSADDVKKVKEEVLEDGGGDEEHGVLLQERERHVRPSEVFVLAVEVALACASPIVVRDYVAFCAVPVVGENAAVHVFRLEETFRFRVRTFFGVGVRWTTSLRPISESMLST